MGAVGREVSGAGLVGVILGATAATWIVLIFVAVLVLIGIAMIITALWVLQNADGDPQALRPLEVMGSRRFRSADPSERRKQLDEVRPKGAGAPAPIVAAAAGGVASGRSSTATSDDKTSSTRRVRRYRAGDAPSSDGDVNGDEGVDTRWGEQASDSEASASASSKRAGRNGDGDADLDVELDADADDDGQVEDWWLDFDDDADQDADDADLAAPADNAEDRKTDDRAPARSRDSRDSAERSGRSARRSGSPRSARGEQSYLDVLADWESDADDEWDDEPDWSAGSAGRRSNRVDDDLDDDDQDDDGYDSEDDDDYDSEDDHDGYDSEDDEQADDDVDESIEDPDYDDAVGLVPVQRRSGAGRGSTGRWRRGGRARRDPDYDDELDDDLAAYTNADYDDDVDDYEVDDYEDDDYEDDDYEDDLDEQDTDMDFDDNDYDGRAPSGTAPGSDPFFDDDFDGDWEESPKPQRSERNKRRPRSGSTGGGRARRRVPSAGMNSFDPEAMVDRFRNRAAAVRRRPLPPVAGEERQEFIRQAKIDYQDFAMIGDAEVTIEDGVLVLRLDLRAD